MQGLTHYLEKQEATGLGYGTLSGMFAGEKVKI
jgi:hypothetical protein